MFGQKQYTFQQKSNEKSQNNSNICDTSNLMLYNYPKPSQLLQNRNQYQSQQSYSQYQQMNSQDQKQEQEDKVKESILMKIIGNAQRLFDEFNMNKKQKMSVVLLIGVTGSGKSTIFNFLSGADFSFNNDKVELEIKNPQNHYSKMATGTNSITKEPNFYHNKQNNHLIIDFPGFQDTNGDQDQLLFELFFQKIVTSGPLKIIYVIKNTESTLPNRATDLQEFIKQLCQKGNIKFEKLNLLLNCYMENLSDEKLQKKSKRSQNLLIYHYQLIKYLY